MRNTDPTRLASLGGLAALTNTNLVSAGGEGEKSGGEQG